MAKSALLRGQGSKRCLCSTPSPVLFLYHQTSRSWWLPSTPSAPTTYHPSLSHPLPVFCANPRKLQEAKLSSCFLAQIHLGVKGNSWALILCWARSKGAQTQRNKTVKIPNPSCAQELTGEEEASTLYGLTSQQVKRSQKKSMAT